MNYKTLSYRSFIKVVILIFYEFLHFGFLNINKKNFFCYVVLQRFGEFNDKKNVKKLVIQLTLISIFNEYV